MRDDKKRLMAKAAYLYYVENRTQEEIARELSVYRTTISRMLQQARELGIVEVHVHHFDKALFDLETSIKQHYGLKELIIVPDGQETDIAQEAAYYLQKIIQPHDVVGLAWGSTLAEMIGKLDMVRKTDTTFVPLVGGPSSVNVQYHVNAIVYDMARHFHGKSIFINASVVQESKKLRDGIMKSGYFQELVQYWEKVNIALVGIGGPLSSKKSQWRDLLTEKDREELRLQEAIGDCCCHFFNRDGKVIKGDLYDRTISIGLEKLRNVPHAVGIAQSKKKARAIVGLLTGKYINTLVTDEETAREIWRLTK
ncbi:sugar-binding transcriptional regulator [Listeria ilorinensis]|uniref:sugar-binding transcriptional regulator n=1 Tax=Listeria ilorinensis TaxID=2867439 RepID=UPI001EF53064|nr:sugar-binding transcriptional regulator [Listeria ilorinensis]